jgi:predicted transcriptional regulator
MFVRHLAAAPNRSVYGDLRKYKRVLTMAGSPVSLDVLGLAARIVAAHVSNNAVESDVLPGLIRDVYTTLAGMGQDLATPAEPADKRQPAVPIKKSVFPDHIVCLEDGKKLKMLKRHLKTAFGLTPEQYRERWGLPHDYPMVAPSYASHRSKLAKKIGLGTKPRESTR